MVIRPYGYAIMRSFIQQAPIAGSRRSGHVSTPTFVGTPHPREPLNKERRAPSKDLRSRVDYVTHGGGEARRRAGGKALVVIRPGGDHRDDVRQVGAVVGDADVLSTSGPTWCAGRSHAAFLRLRLIPREGRARTAHETDVEASRKRRGHPATCTRRPSKPRWRCGGRRGFEERERESLPARPQLMPTRSRR